MAISSDYPRPITVNGYVCRNCDDVSKAKKFEDPSARASDVQPFRETDAVSFGGALASRNVTAATSAKATPQALDRYA